MRHKTTCFYILWIAIASAGFVRNPGSISLEQGGSRIQTLEYGTEISTDFKLVNGTDAKIDVSRIRGSCGTRIVGWASGRIEDGASRAFTHVVIQSVPRQFLSASIVVESESSMVLAQAGYQVTIPTKPILFPVQGRFLSQEIGARCEVSIEYLSGEAPEAPPRIDVPRGVSVRAVRVPPFAWTLEFTCESEAAWSGVFRPTAVVQCRSPGDRFEIPFIFGSETRLLHPLNVAVGESLAKGKFEISRLPNAETDARGEFQLSIASVDPPLERRRVRIDSCDRSAIVFTFAEIKSREVSVTVVDALGRSEVIQFRDIRWAK
jgi:hypothetical protein